MAKMLDTLMTPMNIGLIALIAFAVGMTIVLMRRREQFDQWNIPMTVAEFSNLPRKLPEVTKMPMVTDHDYYYDQFGG